MEKLVEATMLYLSTVEEVKDSELLELGRKHLEVDTPFASAEALRDHLIELISVRNLRHRPEALFALFRQFLQRLSLPRICHFTSWTWCSHNSPQSVPPGRMLLGPYGLVTIFVLSHMKMVNRMSHESQLLTSLRHMTISTMSGYSGAICRSCCFQTRVWSIRRMYMTSKAKRYIDCINSISN